MTECERIIASGRFSSDYLKEETLCDFWVDTDRKKLWMVLLDLLLEFDRVCKKHNLKYVLAYGSLLGAVRHKGFIPWDDDLDVAMFREDYEKLLQIGPGEFSAPYLFQTPETDEGYGFSFVKIRNANTTGISNAFRYEKFNQGLFLDVFPMDNYLPDNAEQTYDTIQALNLENSTYMRLSNPHPSARDQARIAAHSGRHPREVNAQIQSIARQYESIPTQQVCVYVNTILPYRVETFPRSCFDQIIDWEFEGFRFPIPADYDTVLRIGYNAYMEFPPMEKRGNWHDGFFDPDMPYHQYAKRFYE